MTGSGNSYLVTVNSVSGDGTLGLNLADNDDILDQYGHLLGGVGMGNGNFTGQTYTIDHTPPVVVSIIRVGASPTNASSLQFAVTFSENVTGVNLTDFAVPATGTAAGLLSSLSVAGNSYVVTVSNVSGTGTLGLNLVDNDSITDLAGNALGGAGMGNGNFTGQSYTMPPAVVSIIPSGSNPTRATSVPFAVTFNTNVTGVVPADFALALSGATGTISAVSGSGAAYTVTVTGVAGNGTLGLNLVDNDSILDPFGNPLGGTGAGNGNFRRNLHDRQHAAHGGLDQPRGEHSHRRQQRAVRRQLQRTGDGGGYRRLRPGNYQQGQRHDLRDQRQRHRLHRDRQQRRRQRHRGPEPGQRRHHRRPGRQPAERHLHRSDLHDPEPRPPRQPLAP